MPTDVLPELLSTGTFCDFQRLVHRPASRSDKRQWPIEHLPQLPGGSFATKNLREQREAAIFFFSITQQALLPETRAPRESRAWFFLVFSCGIPGKRNSPPFFLSTRWLRWQLTGSFSSHSGRNPNKWDIHSNGDQIGICYKWQSM